MRIGKPDVEGPKSRLAPKADDCEEEAGVGETARRGEAIEVVGTGAPSEKDEQDEEEDHAELRGDEVGHPRASHVLPLVLKRDEEKRGEGHDLPRDEKKDSVPRNDEPRHRSDQQIEERDRWAKAPLSNVGGQVSACVDRGQPRNHKDAEQEERRQCIHRDVRLSQRQRPRAAERGLLPAQKGHECADGTGKTRDHASRRSDGKGRPIKTRKKCGDEARLAQKSNGEKDRPEHQGVLTCEDVPLPAASFWAEMGGSASSRAAIRSRIASFGAAVRRSSFSASS